MFLSVVIGRCLHFLILLVTLKCATSLLSPAEMGRISIFVSTTALFSLMFVGPVGMYVNRRLITWFQNGNANSYLNLFWIYLIFVSSIAVLSVSILSWSNVWIPGFSLTWFNALLFLTLIFSTVNQLSIPSLNLFDRPIQYLLLSLATASLSLIICVFLVQAYGKTSELWLTGMLIGNLLVGLYATTILKKIFSLKSTSNSNEIAKVSKPQLKTLIYFAFPILVASVLNWVQSQSYRYIIEAEAGYATLGLFTAGYGISAGLMGAFDSVFTTYFQPKFYKKISEFDDAFIHSSAWSSYANSIFPALLLTTALIICLAPSLTRLLLGDRYHGVEHFVVFGAIAEMLRLSSGIFALMAHAKMKTKLLLIPNFIGALLAILLTHLLISKYGVIGVAYALILSFLASGYLSFFSIKKYLANHSPFKGLAFALVLSSVLWGFSKIIRINNWLTFQPSTLITDFFQSSLIGLLFMYFLYLILKPALAKHKA